MISGTLVKRTIPAVLALGVLAAPAAAVAQSANGQAASKQSPAATARDAAATWAGFGAAQQLFGPSGAGPAAPSGVTNSAGAVIAPADVNGHVPVPSPPDNTADGILRSAPPTVAVDAEGHGAVVSGVSIR